MWPFVRRKHLKYGSVREWIVANRVPVPLPRIQDIKKRDAYLQEFAELQDDLFRRHLQQLSEEERSAIANGRHASQDIAAKNVVEQYATSLLQEIGHCRFVKSIKGVLSHRPTWYLLVRLSYDPGVKELAVVPEFYHGFRVRLDYAKYDPVGELVAYGVMKVDEVIDLSGQQ